VVFNINRHVIVSGEGSHMVHKAVGDFVEGLQNNTFKPGDSD
jgi:hypothetical protein